MTADNETNQPSLNIVKQSTSLWERVFSAIGFKTRQTSTLSISRELASKLDEETLKALTLEPAIDMNLFLSYFILGSFFLISGLMIWKYWLFIENEEEEF